MVRNVAYVGSAMALLAVAGCGGEQQLASSASEGERAVEVETRLEAAAVASPAKQADAATRVDIPPRTGPSGCGRPSGQIEDRRGAWAVADVSIGMTLDEAIAAIECRSTIELKNPKNPRLEIVDGPAGSRQVETQEAYIRVVGHGGTMTREAFTLQLAGPASSRRVVSIVGQLDYSSDGIARDDLIEKLSKQYGPLRLLPPQNSEQVAYASVEVRSVGASVSGATCDLDLQSVAGCRRLTSVMFLTGQENRVTITTQDNDYWASFALQ